MILIFSGCLGWVWIWGGALNGTAWGFGCSSFFALFRSLVCGGVINASPDTVLSSGSFGIKGNDFLEKTLPWWEGVGFFLELTLGLGSSLWRTSAWGRGKSRDFWFDLVV